MDCQGRGPSVSSDDDGLGNTVVTVTCGLDTLPEDNGQENGSGEIEGPEDGSGEFDGQEDRSGEFDGQEDGSGEIDGQEDGSGEIDSHEDGSGEIDINEDKTEETDSHEDKTEETDSHEDGSGDPIVLAERITCDGEATTGCENSVCQITCTDGTEVNLFLITNSIQNIQ